MLGKLFATLLFAVMVLAAPQGAQAVTYTGPDVSIGSALFCSGSFGCGTGTPTLTLDTSDDATRTASGFVTVVGNLVSFDITVSVIGFTGGPDNGVSDFDLTDVRYLATNQAINAGGTAEDFVASGSAAVTGTIVQTPGGSSALSIAASAYVLDCDLNVPANEFTCALIVAGFPTFSVGIGAVPQTRWVPHTVNLSFVPEPHPSVMMLTAGILGLAYSGRRKV